MTKTRKLPTHCRERVALENGMAFAAIRCDSPANGMMCGIYTITHLPTGAVIYVGMSRRPKERMRGHQTMILAKSHTNKLIQNFIVNRSPGDFEIRLVEWCHGSQMKAREVYWMTKLCPSCNQKRGGI